MERVVNKGLIGRGSFGCVYLVENPAGEQFAIKVMKWLRASPLEKDVVENELRVLTVLAHEHVLAYVDHFMDEGFMYIITEYCSGGDLSGFLDQTGRSVPEDLLKVWLWQMACGLEYMHKHDSGPVLHRDLKPSNVFLTKNGHLRLGDMGIARVLDSKDALATTFCGTLPYMSPEALYQIPYNTKTDIWSLGCCVVEMATLERAYDGSTLLILRDAVKKMRQPLPGQYSRQLDDLLSKMLQVNFSDRASASEVLDDPVLSDYGDFEPLELLRKHKLTEALALHMGASPSTTSTGLLTTTKTLADESLPTLRNSLANLAKILDEGEPVTTYRVKIDRRMRGRQQSEDTVINSSVLKTVLYKPNHATKTKSEKKTLKVPEKQSSAHDGAVASPEPDDALSRPVLSALNATVTTILQREKSHAKSDRSQKATRDPAASDQEPHGNQMSMLRSSLSQALGRSTLEKARTLVERTVDHQELKVQLAPLMGEYESILSNMVIYLLLMESSE